MIELTKINREPILINSRQIEFIEIIPESKVVMLNGKYHIVKENKDEIIAKIERFEQVCFKELIFKEV